MARRPTSARFAVLLLCLGCALFFAALRYVDPHPMRMLELRALDARQQLRGPLPVGSEVAIIAVDEHSLTELGRWPWPRSRIAELITKLTDLGTAAIALDIVFAEPQPEDDPALAGAIRDSGRVVLGYFIDFAALDRNESPAGLSSYNMLKPGLGRSPGEAQLPNALRVVGNIPEIAASARRAGYFNVLPDDDGIFRRVPLGIRHASQGAPPRVLSPLSLEALRRTQRSAILGMAFDDGGVSGVTLAGYPHPRRCGRRSLGELRRTCPHVPALLCSGRHRRTDQRRSAPRPHRPRRDDRDRHIRHPRDAVRPRLAGRGDPRQRHRGRTARPLHGHPALARLGRYCGHHPHGACARCRVHVLQGPPQHHVPAWRARRILRRIAAAVRPPRNPARHGLSDLVGSLRNSASSASSTT